MMVRTESPFRDDAKHSKDIAVAQLAIGPAVYLSILRVVFLFSGIFGVVAGLADLKFVPAEGFLLTTRSSLDELEARLMNLSFVTAGFGIEAVGRHMGQTVDDWQRLYVAANVKLLRDAGLTFDLTDVGTLDLHSAAARVMAALPERNVPSSGQ
jgi:hypothetical protein